MTDSLKKHREIWQNKKILRDIYTKWYQKIISNLSNVPGKTLELGSGSGNFKEFKPDIITSDIDPQPWLDMSFDAHNIPFEKNSLANIVLVDVLHHLSNPIKFLHEAERTLSKGGRIIMVEPFPSFFSSVIYKLFHPEPFIYDIDYFSKEPFKNKKPWESNQAIPYLIFFKYINKFNKEFCTSLKINRREKISFILYPLSGGFEKNQIIPSFLIPIAKLFEFFLMPFSSIFAFRCFLSIEKI